MPVSVEWIRKDQPATNKKTGRVTYKSAKTKNGYFREMVYRAIRQVHFKKELADSWFSGVENLNG